MCTDGKCATDGFWSSGCITTHIVLGQVVTRSLCSVLENKESSKKSSDMFALNVSNLVLTLGGVKLMHTDQKTVYGETLPGKLSLSRNVGS